MITRTDPMMFGSLMTSLCAESGPGAYAAGAWGATVGAQIGRYVFSNLGRIYNDIFVVLKIRRQLKELNNYNNIHYPIMNP